MGSAPAQSNFILMPWLPSTKWNVFLFLNGKSLVRDISNYFFQMQLIHFHKTYAIFFQWNPYCYYNTCWVIPLTDLAFHFEVQTAVQQIVWTVSVAECNMDHWHKGNTIPAGSMSEKNSLFLDDLPVFNFVTLVFWLSMK